MACRKMNEDVAYARNTESGCKNSAAMIFNNKQRLCDFLKTNHNQIQLENRKSQFKPIK